MNHQIDRKHPMGLINQLTPKADLKDMSRRERKKQETRWRIFDAAMLLMQEHGYDAITIESICEKADVSTPLFFHHFSSKGSLIRTYLALSDAKIRQKLDAASDASSTEKLGIINREVAKSSQQSVAFTPEMLAETLKGQRGLDLSHLDSGSIGLLAKVIRDGQEAGEFDESWNPEVAALQLFGAWLILPLAAQSKGTAKAYLEEALNITISGLKSKNT